MTQMRRLEAPKAGDPFERGRTSPVRSFDIEREEFERLRQERPELVVSDDAGVMVLSPHGGLAWLHYGFESVDALRGHFRPMLERLLSLLRSHEAQAGVFLWLTDLPNRPYVEPVLNESLFELLYEYMEMDLPELPDAPQPTDELAPGFLLRAAGPDDTGTIAALVEAVFGEDTARRSVIDDNVRRSVDLRVIEEKSGGRLVGLLGCLPGPERTGEIAVMGVHPDYRRRSLGEAMMRWSLAWFREQGMRRAKLNARVDSPTAIALYRKLGFLPGRRGLVYRRPTDKRELDEMAAKRKGTYIKFGGWR